MRSFTLKLPDDLAERLEAEADRQGVSGTVELIGGWVMDRLSAIDLDPVFPPLTPVQRAEIEDQCERDRSAIMTVVEERLADGPVGIPLEEAFDRLRARLRRAAADGEQDASDDKA